jgi:tetratricopeptide (TPR) repeat protein/V8-like Glu-specific endopeptidase
LTDNVVANKNIEIHFASKINLNPMEISMMENKSRSIAIVAGRDTIFRIGLTIALTVAMAPAATALSAVEVGKIAKSVTVSIDSENSIGSGVTIAKQGNTYTVLTAAHVVRNPNQKFKLTTPDGKSYPLLVTNIKATNDADLAIVKFQSAVDYPIAKLGKVETASEGSIVYVAGFPLATTAISESIYNFTEGKVTANANRPLAGGYSLVYSNNTLPGMSGGPVFNQAGETIAIHGKGDVQESTQSSNINENIRIKTGFNLGIPIDTFMRLAGTLGVSLGGQAAIIAAQQTPKPLQAVDWFLIGVDRFNRSNLGGSIAAMNEAIKLNPRYPKAYLARAAANFMFARIGAALADADLAIKSDPNSAIAHGGKCFFLSEFGKNAEALGVCDRAVKLDPKNALSYNARGLVALRLGNYSGAAADLQQAIALNPNIYYAYNNLAITRAAQGNNLEALALSRRSVQIAPQSAGARAFLGEMLVKNRQYQQALAELNRALGMNPRQHKVYKYRSIAHQALGNLAQAKLDAQLAKQFAIGQPDGFIDDISFLNQ